jgi:nicotinate-nucleotide adenylyltransferase
MPPDKRTGRRICLFGGTFDPIHEAHLRIAEEALADFLLDRVLFVPAAHPPHKDPAAVTPYEDRFRMVEIACRYCPRFEVSRLEEGDERSFTIDTLRRFRKQLAPGDRLFFLIGSDAFEEIESWKDWRDVLELTEFIVVSRPGGHYRVPSNARVHRLDGLALPVSSSTIRERLAAGQPTPELPAAVRRFIEAHGLYGFPTKPVTVSP